MTDSTYQPGQHPDLPPPANTTGPIGWVRENLLSSWLNIVLTVLSGLLVYFVVSSLYRWGFATADFTGASRQDCTSGGACWALIDVRFGQFIYGFYPEGQRWRVNLAFVGFIVALWPILFDNAPARKQLIWFSGAYPVLAFVLLLGGFGLESVETAKFGGFMLTLVIGVTGIAVSLPLGIVLALGRRSDMIFIRVLSIGFIEFIRGVPLITLLFVASTLLSFFLPPGTTFDLLLRVLIMVTLFSAAYLAEVVRGGLQAIPVGQREAAESLGLGYWRTMYLIILPQALKISIPGIVNSFIGLFKDTTLVAIIGLLDPLGIGRAALADTKWQGLSSEVYVFVAILFFIFSFSMSRYSLFLEKKLQTGHAN